MSKVISNVESVTTAAKIVSAQKVETSQLCIDGKDLQALKEERAPSYKELVTRMELPEDEIWALYTDNGDIVYWHNADKMDTNLASYAFYGAGFNQLPKGLNYEKMTSGRCVFAYCKNLTHINQNFSNLYEENTMFGGCSSLKKFKGSLNNLYNGGYMFKDSPLIEFDSNLSALTVGDYMFYNCKLNNFNVSLPNLTDGPFMFSRNTFKEWLINLPLLTNGAYMFYNCPSLTYFSGELISLKLGDNMFQFTTLISFTSKLKADDAEYSPLTSGANMFYGCKLDAPSVENILTSLQPFTDGSEHIMTMRIQSAAVEKFNEITGNTLTLNRQYQNVPFRGWTVQVAII